MPKVNATISCKFPGNVNINHVSQAISDVIRSMTGSNVQVIANQSQIKSSPVDMYLDKSKKKRRNIELIP